MTTLAPFDLDRYDCARAKCPTGDDPLTPGVNEVQTVQCCGTTGVFTLAFRGNRSEYIDAGASAATYRNAIQAMSMIGALYVLLDPVSTLVSAQPV